MMLSCQLVAIVKQPLYVVCITMVAMALHDNFGVLTMNAVNKTVRIPKKDLY